MATTIHSSHIRRSRQAKYLFLDSGTIDHSAGQPNDNARAPKLEDLVKDPLPPQPQQAVYDEKATAGHSTAEELVAWRLFGEGVALEVATSESDDFAVSNQPYISPRVSYHSRKSVRRPPEQFRTPLRAKQLHDDLSAILDMSINGSGFDDIRAPLQKVRKFMHFLERERPLAYNKIIDVVAQLVVSRLIQVYGGQVSPSIKEDRILLSELPGISSPAWKKYLITAHPSTNGTGYSISENTGQGQSNGYRHGGMPEPLAKMKPAFYLNGHHPQPKSASSHLQGYAPAHSDGKGITAAVLRASTPPTRLF